MSVFLLISFSLPFIQVDLALMSDLVNFIGKTLIQKKKSAKPSKYSTRTVTGSSVLLSSGTWWQTWVNLASLLKPSTLVCNHPTHFWQTWSSYSYVSRRKIVRSRGGGDDSRGWCWWGRCHQLRRVCSNDAQQMMAGPTVLIQPKTNDSSQVLTAYCSLYYPGVSLYWITHVQVSRLSSPLSTTQELHRLVRACVMNALLCASRATLTQEHLNCALRPLLSLVVVLLMIHIIWPWTLLRWSWISHFQITHKG